jgi:hypothetical protein
MRYPCKRLLRPRLLGRSTQGITRPFRCRGANGTLYYVKGRNCDRRGLICEWLGSYLARAFGLPVAPFNVVEISPTLLEACPPELREIGDGYGFGSQAADVPLELTWGGRRNVPNHVRRDLLVYDYWVRNADRTLTPVGGNRTCSLMNGMRSLAIG